MIQFRHPAPLLILISLCVLSTISRSEEETKRGAKSKKRTGFETAEVATVPPFAQLNDPDLQEDFPAMCLNAEGKPIVVFIEHNGEADTLRLAEFGRNGKLVPLVAVSEDHVTNITQPCLTRLAGGRLLCVWSQLETDGQWDLVSRVIGRRGKATIGDPVRLTEGNGNDIFPDIGTDRQGRVWVTWQSLEKGIARIQTRHGTGDPVKWSDTIAVTDGKRGGDWEPRLAFGKGNEALIVFDSYRAGDFDVYLTRISPDGVVSEPLAVAQTDRYEARPEAAASPDGKSLWVAYEDGITRWGKDLGAEWRQKGGGLHHDRQLKVVRVNLDTNEVEKIADITALLPDLVADPQSVGTGAIDLPEVIIDNDGNPWIFFRFCLFKSPGFWQIACTKLDLETGSWTKPEIPGQSAFCLDRRSPVALNPDNGVLLVAYAGDGRKDKQAGDAGIFLAKIDPASERETAGPMPFDLVAEAPSLLQPYNNTPERGRDNHHTWEIAGEKYQLVWGDVHRHTDFSNCRTTDDGCIVEHFRYAIEAGGLDFLGTSDHTEVGKRFTAYEWWQTQKFADLFHNPGSFLSVYAYEREQVYPYGHRNVLFLERGGPVIYIKRKNYQDYTVGAKPLPAPDGDRVGEIPPWQLWDLLRAHGQRAITIEHTSAGRMGTDWRKYERLDSEFENILEVFQGSRNSSEGEEAPQPPVVVGGPRLSRFAGKDVYGTWQTALGLNHRLGAFASSDHRSTNLSYGGVYVKNLDRKNLFDAMDGRRTVAATDKIFMEFSCNGHVMGEEIDSAEPPAFQIKIHGTAPISKVTLIRNEKDYQIFKPEQESVDWTEEFIDGKTVPGEYRYYLRVEQIDGNMGWTSPVWVNVK